MFERVSPRGSVLTQQIDEHTSLLSTHARLLNIGGQAPEDTTQSVVKWAKHYITPVIMPILCALNGSAITSTIITLSAGWPRKVPKVIAPAMYVGLPFNAIGFLDALAQEYKINRLNKFRHGYRVLINGTNTALFSLQLLIAILDDIFETRNKPFDVSNAAFAGICVGPALLGLITVVVQGLNIQRPSDLKNLKNKIRYALHALLDLTNNASTAHSFIQDMAALTHPLTSPSGMLVRYSLALAPALSAEAVKISEHIPESWISDCLQNCPRSFLYYLRSSPEQLFLIISALNYAIFNEEIMRNNENDFSATGATMVYLFWFYIFLAPLIVRFYGGLSPSPDSRLIQANNGNLQTYYDVESPRGVPQEDSAGLDDDVEGGRLADQVDLPDATLVRQECRDIWGQELPFAEADFAALVEHPQEQLNAREGAAESVVPTDSQRLDSRDDLSVAQAPGSAQHLAAVSASPIEEVKQQLPIVAQQSPLAPNSAQHLRRHSIHAEMQRLASAQQQIDEQKLKRTHSSESVLAP